MVIICSYIFTLFLKRRVIMSFKINDVFKTSYVHCNAGGPIDINCESKSLD